MTEWWREHVVGTGRSSALWLLLGFVVTYAVVRWTTVTIRRRNQRGVAATGHVKDVHIGGVHVHHQVWGILLLLTVGLMEFRFRPSAPWVEVLAVLFGAGAALTLDEFALWLHLEDVYWTEKGRKSIDAVLIAAVAVGVLLVGASPVGVPDSEAAPRGGPAVTAFLLLHLAYTVVCLLKGKLVTGLVGLPVPLVPFIGALRLAHPDSFWARRFYDDPTMDRARRRHEALDRRRERLRDLLSGA